MTSPDLNQALQTMSRLVVSDMPLGQMLGKVAELTRATVPSADVVGFSFFDREGRPSTPIYTDEKSPRIDDAQYEDKSGPCLDAARQKAVIRIDDTAAAGDTYPAFSKVSQEEGIRSTLSVPLVVNDRGIGAMNLYSKQEGAIAPEDETTALAIGSNAAATIANASAYWSAQATADNLNEAMKTRAVIEQAKGVLMGQQRGTTPDEAFELLVKASQRENLKLRDIAQRIVDAASSRPS